MPNHLPVQLPIIFTIAGLIPWLSFALQGNIGLSLWDEGYLWYGAQRVLEGEVPLRDFQSYDIARYYWTAGVMGLLGSKGVIALRVSNALLQSAALILAVRLATWKQQHFGIYHLVLLAFSYFLWMYPDYKASDFFATILLLYSIAYLVDKPNTQRYLLVGIIVGLSAIIGRNHGVYGVFGSVFAMTYLWWICIESKPFHVLMVWGSGVFIGYLPMLIIIALVPRMPQAMIGSINAMIEYGSTNLALPFPLFWKVQFYETAWLESLSDLFTGMIFILVLSFTVTSILILIHRVKIKDSTLNPAFVSSVSLMVSYAHYALSRADLAHLALGIFPFLIGFLTFPAGQSRIFVNTKIVVLAVASSLTLVAMQPLYRIFHDENSKPVTVMGDTLNVTAQTASEIALLEDLCARYAQKGRTFLAMPFWPGAYAVMGRKSPIWEIYTVFPQKESFQQAEITRLHEADIGFAVITDTLLDGREDLLYQVTHPSIERYIRAHFQPLAKIDAPFKPRVFVATDQK